LPVIPNFIERQLFRLQPKLAPFLDLWGVGSFEVVLLASRLGVFEALREGPKTVSTIAKKIDASERGTKSTLDLLVSIGYLKESAGSYSLTPLSKSFAPGSSFQMAETFALYAGLYEFMRENQEQAIREGKPRINAFEWFSLNPPMWELFHYFEMSIAKQIEKDIVSKVKIPSTARKMLDVGGGHGLYSIMMCKRHPGLSAIIFDSPAPLEETKGIIESERMGKQVSTRAGDFFVDDLGEGYDVAILFNIIHLFTPERNSQLLRRVAAALRSGGTIVIFDQFLGGEFGKVLRLGHTFYNLLFLVTTGGQLYTLKEVSGLLSESGFASLTRRPVRAAGSTLVFATKV
jgi:hypothetical protein